MNDETRYTRWYTPRTTVANAIDIVRGLADIACVLSGIYLLALAASAALGDSPKYAPEEAPALAVLGFAAFGGGRTLGFLLGQPADWLRPGWGVFPGSAVPPRIHYQVRGYLTGRAAARTSEIADALDLPRSTAVAALRNLAAEGRAVRHQPWAWAAADEDGQEEYEAGPQIPLTGESER